MTLAAASPTKVPAFWATEIRLAEATTWSVSSRSIFPMAAMLGCMKTTLEESFRAR